MCLSTRPVDCQDIILPASEMTSLSEKKITVQSRMMFATNPSFDLTSIRCFVASALMKMNASSWRKRRIAILYEVQVGKVTTGSAVSYHAPQRDRDRDLMYTLVHHCT